MSKSKAGAIPADAAAPGSKRRRRVDTTDNAVKHEAGTPTAEALLKLNAANADLRAVEAVFASTRSNLVCDPHFARLTDDLNLFMAQTPAGKAYTVAANAVADSATAAKTAANDASKAVMGVLGDGLDVDKLKAAVGGVGVVEDAEERGSRVIRVRVAPGPAAAGLEDADGVYVPPDGAVAAICSLCTNPDARVYDATKPPKPEPVAVTVSEKTSLAVTTKAFQTALTARIEKEQAARMEAVLEDLLED